MHSLQNQSKHIWLNNLIFLTQTDTTVGFLSKNPKILNLAKRRDENQKILKVVSSFHELKNQTRVPNRFKRFLRHSKKATFIYPNGDSFRVVFDKQHKEFLKKFGSFYSTSANENKKSFDLEYAISKCDCVVEDSRGFFEDTPSKIYKINRTQIKKIR
ncbi:MAG: Sua5 YciO YrdC YwlC family protein [Campylobacterales bacterium]|nr:Sua5 YciO YrdC YwlC family protein [Campylobacterales bacterium]